MQDYPPSIASEPPTLEPTADCDPDLDAAAESVWLAMVSVFGGNWINAYGDAPPALWRAALANLTPEQIERGVRYFALEAATPRAFPPALPEFRFRCLGVPSVGEAVSDAISGNGTDPFVQRLIDSVPDWDRRTLSTDALERRYRTRYEAVLRDAVADEAAPDNGAAVASFARSAAIALRAV